MLRCMGSWKKYFLAALTVPLDRRGLAPDGGLVGLKVLAAVVAALDDDGCCGAFGIADEDGGEGRRVEVWKLMGGSLIPERCCWVSCGTKSSSTTASFLLVSCRFSRSLLILPMVLMIRMLITMMIISDVKFERNDRW